MSEIWKDVVDYEGLYMVSNLGNVKSLPRTTKSTQGNRRSSGKMLSLHPNSKGYIIVRPCKNGKSNTLCVHKLVAQSFLSFNSHNLDNLVVDHINNNRKDNRVENLQLITNRENCSKDKKNKSSKYTGVYLDKSRNKWLSRIQIKGNNIVLGRFDSEIEASNAYELKLKELNFTIIP